MLLLSVLPAFCFVLNPFLYVYIVFFFSLLFCILFLVWSMLHCVVNLFLCIGFWNYRRNNRTAVSTVINLFRLLSLHYTCALDRTVYPVSRYKIKLLASMVLVPLIIVLFLFRAILWIIVNFQFWITVSWDIHVRDMSFNWIPIKIMWHYI